MIGNESNKKRLCLYFVLHFIFKYPRNTKGSLPQKRVNKVTNEVGPLIPYIVESNPRLTGDDLQDARVQIDQQKNEPYVSSPIPHQVEMQ